MYRIARSLVLCLSVLVVDPIAFSGLALAAAEKPAAGSEQSDDRSQRIFKAFLRSEREVEALVEGSRSLSGENFLAMQYRIHQERLNALRTLNGLIDAIYDKQKSGDNVDAILKQVSPVLLAIGPRIIESIDKENSAYIEQSATAEQLTSEGLRVYLEHLNRISMSLAVHTNITIKNELIGIDDGVSTRYLKDTLVDRAENFIGILKINKTKQQELERLLRVSPTDESLLLQKSILLERAAIAIDHFRKTNELLQRFGVGTDRYQKYLIATSGQITTEMLDISIVSSMLVAWGHSIVDLVAEHGVEVAFKILIFFMVLMGFRFLSRFVKRLLRQSLDKSKLNMSSLMRDMMVSTVGSLVMLLGILIALSQLGVSLAPLLAGLGVAGFIIGFALQDTLGNFASGMMILIYRPYDVGDMVDISGVFGQVESMSLVSTTILTIDNQTLVIPNNKIWGDVIRNVTAQKIRRVDMVFGIGYSDDIEHAERIFTSILEEHEAVLSTPESIVKLNALGESSVDFVVRPWVKTEDYWNVYWDVTREVKLRLDREGLNIPFPQRDLHIYQETLTPKVAE